MCKCSLILVATVFGAVVNVSMVSSVHKVDGGTTTVEVSSRGRSGRGLREW